MDVNGKLRLVLVESIRAALVRARVGDSGMVWGCNSCNALVPSGATLYHCWECDDYDLCTSCHTTGQSKAPHTASHMTEERVVLPDGNVQPAGMQTTAQGDTSKDKQAQEEAVALLQTFCLSASTWLSFIPCTSDTATLLRSGPTLEGAALLGLAQSLLTAMERIIDHIKQRKTWLYIGAMDVKLKLPNMPDEWMEVFAGDTVRDLKDKVAQFIKVKSADCISFAFNNHLLNNDSKTAEEYGLQHECTLVVLLQEELSLDGIKQFWIDVGDQGDKFAVLDDIYGLLEIGQSVIFVERRETAKRLTQQMREAGHAVTMLTGGKMEHEDRDRVMNEFRSGTTKVLICTNVLARGVDVAAVSLVVNYDVPVDRSGLPDTETYLHRIARTGRFGRKGCAVNLVKGLRDKQTLLEIERHYDWLMTQVPVDDVELLEKAMAVDALVAEDSDTDYSENGLNAAFEESDTDSDVDSKLNPGSRSIPEKNISQVLE